MSAMQPKQILAERLLPGCMAFFMSALVTATAVFVNSAALAGLGSAFLHAWAVSLPVAVLAAYITKPLATRLAKALSGAIEAIRR